MLSEEEIEEIKRNIEAWETEKQQWLGKGDIASAVFCELLAENLRKEIGR